MTVISAISGALLISILCETSAVKLPNSTDLFQSVNINQTDVEAALAAHLDSASLPKSRKKRYISQNDMVAILDYHNQVRGKVFPPAANMEYMVSRDGHFNSFPVQTGTFRNADLKMKNTSLKIHIPK